MPPDDPWRCNVCRVHYPIQPLARDCEARHARAEEDDDERTDPRG